MQNVPSFTLPLLAIDVRGDRVNLSLIKGAAFAVIVGVIDDWDPFRRTDDGLFDPVGSGAAFDASRAPRAKRHFGYRPALL